MGFREMADAALHQDHGAHSGERGEEESQTSPSSSPKLSDVVYEKILARVVDETYVVGTRLPAETTMAQEFAISRPVIREALARLRDDGVIKSRRGSGNYIQRAPSRAAVRLAPLSSIADMGRCYEFRMSLEGEVAYHAALPESAVHRHHLDEALNRLEAAVERNALGAEEDFEFHCAIARATGNRFFEASLVSLRDSVILGMTLTRTLSLLRPRERLLAVHREHRDIAAAIRANDRETARRAMRSHIENARRRVFEGTDS